MPRSRSKSFESMTRSATSSLARKIPLWRSMESTSVVLPWSTWAMMAMLRVLSFRVLLELKREQVFLRLAEGCVSYYVAMSRVQELVSQFEAQSVRLVDFRHAEHLEVALWYLIH